MRRKLIDNEKYRSNRTSDPFVTAYEGKYYHCYCTKGGVCVSVCDDLFRIGEAEERQVFSADGVSSPRNWFAPELYKIGENWYIYGAPEFGEAHRMAVLKSKTDSPIGDYEYCGELGINTDWSLDGTRFLWKGKSYFLWSAGDRLKIEETESPTKLKGDGKVIGTLTLPHETICGRVMEGPFVWVKGGKAFLLYSVNDSRTDAYSLCLMTLRGDDPLSAAAWEKAETPWLTSGDGVFGPGHCSCTETADGKAYVVYHANEISGTGWNGRSVYADEIEIADGKLKIKR